MEIEYRYLRVDIIEIIEIVRAERRRFES